MELIFATHNPNKVREISTKLGKGFQLLSLRDIGYSNEIPEDHDTLEDNALQKARAIHAAFGKDCFADDTGLEVDALKGKPGVHSARYAGPECDSLQNIKKLLKEMKGVSQRSARFRTVIALIIDGKEHLFEGGIEGQITLSEKGLKGFGYDPVFVPKGHSITFAEMSLEDKNKISHRARAFAKMIEFLDKKAY